MTDEIKKPLSIELLDVDTSGGNAVYAFMIDGIETQTGFDFQRAQIWIEVSDSYELIGITDTDGRIVNPVGPLGTAFKLAVSDFNFMFPETGILSGIEGLDMPVEIGVLLCIDNGIDPPKDQHGYMTVGIEGADRLFTVDFNDSENRVVEWLEDRASEPESRTVFNDPSIVDLDDVYPTEE